MHGARRTTAILAVALTACASAAQGADKGGRFRIAPADLPAGMRFESGVTYGAGAAARHQQLDILSFADSERPRPAIVIIHGGGFTMGNRTWCHELMLMYAKDGYVTLSPEYRLSQEAPFPAMVQDCKTAIRWLRANARRYGVDSDRIACMGGSAGAYLTAMVALTDATAKMEGPGYPDQSSRVQAAVCLSGAYDMRLETIRRLSRDKPLERGHPGGVSLLIESEPARRRRLIDELLDARRSKAARADIDLELIAKHPDVAARASPVTHLSADDPPLLAFHARHDSLDVRFADEFARVLEAAGRADRVVIVPGDTHGLAQPVKYPQVRKAIDAFFAEHLGRLE